MKKGCATCAEVPYFDRLNYFYGQMLGARDLQSEQAYFREKMKLHNRCLHGWGTVCGLEVVPVLVDTPCPPEQPGKEPIGCQEGRVVVDPAPGPEQPAPRPQPQPPLHQEPRGSSRGRGRHQSPAEHGATSRAEAVSSSSPGAERDGGKAAAQPSIEQSSSLGSSQYGTDANPSGATYWDPCAEPAIRPQVIITCGLALDPQGNEIVLRHPIYVDLYGGLSREERSQLSPMGTDLYISVAYRDLPIEPVRPIISDACGAASGMVSSRIRDAVCVKVSIKPPVADERCETCCNDEAHDGAVFIARIAKFDPNKPVAALQIFNQRRMLTKYPLTTITGISWVHGGAYTAKDASEILGTYNKNRGIELRFSRPVYASSLRPGVVDIWVVESGNGRSAGIYNVDGQYLDVPSDKFTDRIRYRQTTEESLQHGDRVIITVRSAFILDHCCQPVDGANVGGRVPLISPDYKEFAIEPDPAPTSCTQPPHYYGPWSTGVGTPGTIFESWFYIK